MATEVYHNSMGYKTVVTIDQYGNTTKYSFRPADSGVGVEPHNSGGARDYTLPVLNALWDEGVPVDWSPDDLTASERAKLDGFCGACSSELRQTQTGPNTYRTECPECGAVGD